VWLCEHRHSLKEDLKKKKNSKLAQHAYEEGHRIGWDELEFWKLKVTAGIENIRNHPIWHA
jgi:hypothetical protein